MIDRQLKTYQTLGAFMGLVNLAKLGLIPTEFFLKRCIEIAAEYEESETK